MARRITHPFEISSDPVNGAQGLTALGSRFYVQYDPALSLPQDARSVTVSVLKAQIWNTTPNVSTNLGNDTFTITGPDTLDVPTVFSIEIPSGLYDLPGLNSELARQLTLAGAKTSGGPLITLQGNQYTQRVEMTFNYAGVTVDFSAANAPYQLLGFAALSYGPSLAGDVEIAPSIADFAYIQSYQIRSSLANPGLRINGRTQDVLATIPITSAPGFQILYEPRTPIELSQNWLAGVQLSEVTYRLCDQVGNEVDTLGEPWSALIEISYDI